MAIIVMCRCGERFRAEDADAGAQVPCPGCQRTLVIRGRRVAGSQLPSLTIARQEVNGIGVSRQPAASTEIPMSDLVRNQTSSPNADSQLARHSRLSGSWVGWAIVGGLASLCVVAAVVTLLWNATRPQSSGVDKHTSGPSESSRDGKGMAPAKKPPERDSKDSEPNPRIPEQHATAAGQEGFPKAANTKYGLSEAERRLIFQELVRAIDRFGEEAAKTNEWPRITAKYRIDGDILETIVEEGLDNRDWLLPATESYTIQTKMNRVEWLKKRNRHQFNPATPRGNTPKLVISPPRSRPQPSARGPEDQHQVRVDGADSRLPIPDAEAQRKATEVVQELYHDKIEAATTAARKQALGRELLVKAKETPDDPAGQYVLLRDAGGLTVKAGDIPLAFEVIEEMDRRFMVDARSMRARVIAAATKAAVTPHANILVAEAVLSIMEQAIVKGQYETAMQLGDAVRQAAEGSEDPALVEAMRACRSRAESLSKDREEIKAAAARLEKDPDDPRANLVLGRQYCFSKNDWEKGLAMLALGPDSALRTAAQRDLRGEGAVGREQMAIGDAWREVAGTEEDPAKRKALGRAAYWYRKAITGLSGLTKATAEKRLAEVETATRGAAPGREMPLRSPFDCRKEPARLTFLRRHGGNSESEAAVQAGLNWLARHQLHGSDQGTGEPGAHAMTKSRHKGTATRPSATIQQHTLSDGSWNLQKYTSQCKDGSCTGTGQVTADTGATAMGLLAFLATGQTHKTEGPYRGNIAAAINWLIRNQESNGNLAKNCVQPMYSHGLATIALCEAYGLSGDKNISMAAQGAVNYIINAQNQNDGGWRYNPGDAGDTSVASWQVMALKSAQMAGLQVGDSTFGGASKWFDSVQTGPNNSLYCYQPGRDYSNTMTAAGLLCRQYLGVKRADPMMQQGTKYLLAHLPDTQLPNIYYWYYASQVLHNMSGDEWDQWNRKMRKILVESQCRDASTCANGSWNPAGDLWASRGGRVMMTSLVVLTLEIYYRYAPLWDDGGQVRP